MASLAVKYRPKIFEDICDQQIIIKILKKQIELKSYPNCYLFAGNSGIGKTTLAKILANEINNGKGLPIEIDAASNNGVDNIRSIIADAKERSLDSEYKVIIFDEAQMLTNAAWAAFLKCLEEPPKYTIFILCTTAPNKIDITIQNRSMRFNLTNISLPKIEQRLNYICHMEGFTNYIESTAYISKISEGSMRTAISYLEKVAAHDSNITIENTLKVLGNYSYDILFKLVNSIIDLNNNNLLEILDNIFNEGEDLKLFIDQLIEFVLDLGKYCILKNTDNIKIPSTMFDKLEYTVGIENNISYFKWLLGQLFELKQNINYDSNIKTTITIKLLQLIRGN